MAACCVWDITCPALRNDKDNLIRAFKAHAKKWVFQRERGEEKGYEHFQCRVDLKHKLRPAAFRALLEQEDIHGFHASPTSSQAIGKAKFEYVMKEDTRIEGPWRDDPKEHFPALFRMPLDNPRPWQKSVLELPYDDRKINIVFDYKGGSGKSSLMRAMCLFQDGIHIHQFKDFNHMCAPIIAHEHAFGLFTLIVDLPRALPTSKEISAICSNIETLKTGHVVDSRYSHKEKWLLNPRVIVFTNWNPSVLLEHLSRDRPVTWLVDKDHHLTIWNGMDLE